MAKCETMRETMDLMSVCQKAKVGYHTGLGWALRGLIQAERVNGKWQADRAGVERFLASRESRRPDLTPAA
jgi:predicted site-specific integrase-resolvase